MSKKALLWILIIIAMVLLLWPYVWQVITSFKTPTEITAIPVRFLPHTLYLKNYSEVFGSGLPFVLYIVNSLVIAGTATLLSLSLGILCGYAVSRIPMKGSDLVLFIFLGVAMFPQVAVISPLFLVLRQLHLLNTHIGLALVYTAFGLPLTVWLLSNFFRDLPKELEEAGLVDGCTPFTVLTRIMLPAAAPGIFSTAILVFVFSWNEFLFALVFNTGINMRTVTVGITLFPGLYETPWGTIFAAATIVTLPLLALVLLFQSQIVSGLTAGAVK
jgi:multiple sugar transport system permease protein